MSVLGRSADVDANGHHRIVAIWPMRTEILGEKKKAHGCTLPWKMGHHSHAAFKGGLVLVEPPPLCVFTLVQLDVHAIGDTSGLLVVKGIRGRRLPAFWLIYAWSRCTFSLTMNMDGVALQPPC